MSYEFHFGILTRSRFSIREFHTISTMEGRHLAGFVDVEELCGQVEGVALSGCADVDELDGHVANVMLVGRVKTEVS